AAGKSRHKHSIFSVKADGSDARGRVLTERLASRAASFRIADRDWKSALPRNERSKAPTIDQLTEDSVRLVKVIETKQGVRLVGHPDVEDHRQIVTLRAVVAGQVERVGRGHAAAALR